MRRAWSLALLLSGCTSRVGMDTAPHDAASGGDSEAGAGGDRDAVAGDSNGSAIPVVTVDPIFPVNGARWNDYVRNDDPFLHPRHQDDEACTPGDLGRNACVHAGELKRVTTSLTTCDDYYASDDLGLFAWFCEGEGGVAVFYTEGLVERRGLSHLVSAAGWRPNRVVINKVLPDSSTIVVARSEPAVWWSNPVVPAATSEAGVVELDVAGTIYTLGSMHEGHGYNLTADRVGFVMLPDIALGLLDVPARTCDRNTGEIGTAHACLIAAGNQRYLWIEGELFGVGTGVNETIGLALAHCSFSRLNNWHMGIAFGTAVEVNSSDSIIARGLDLVDSFVGLFIWDTTESLFEHMSAARNDSGVIVDGDATLGNLVRELSVVGSLGDGITITGTGTSDNRFEQLTISGSGGNGLVVNADRNRYLTIRTAANGGDGVMLDDAHDNLFYDVTSATNEGCAIANHDGDDNVFARVVSINDIQPANPCFGAISSDGGADRNIVSHATVLNAGGLGIAVGTGFENVVTQAVVANSDSENVRVAGTSSDNTFSQLAVAHTGSTWQVALASGPNTFVDNLLVGGGCEVVTAGIGLIEPTCSDTGLDGDTTYTGELSNARFQTSTVDFTASFAGKVTDDTENGTAPNGVAPYAPNLNWLGFESRYRGFGREGGAFPADDHRGNCTAGTCRIWDVRLRAADTALRNRSGDGATANEPFVGGQACPAAAGGRRTLRDPRTAAGVFLVNALEIMDDAGVNAGDDDGLCESTEACVYSPNFGAYQGEGRLEDAQPCVFSGGGVADVVLIAYPENGVP
jgi:hypothetical protein